MTRSEQLLVALDAGLEWVFGRADTMDDIITLGMGRSIDRMIGLRPDVENKEVFEQERLRILRRGNELNIWAAILALAIWTPEMVISWRQPLWTLGAVFVASLMHQYLFMRLARRYPKALQFYFSFPDYLALTSTWQQMYVEYSGWSVSSFYALACWHRIGVICLVKESFTGSMMYLLLFVYLWAFESRIAPEDVFELDAHTAKYAAGGIFVMATFIYSTLRAKVLYCELAAAEVAKLDHLKDVFHFVSHEYRNHFFAGTMALDSLHSNKNLSPGAQRDVEVLDRAHRNISALMENVLQMSQLDSNNQKIWQGEAAPFRVSEDLVMMLRKYGEAVSGVRFGRNVTIMSHDTSMHQKTDHVCFELTESDAVRTLPPVVGSVSLLLQATNNLVSNAIKFTPPGGLVSVSVDVEPCAAPNKVRLLIAVSDTGRGISEEARATIFEPFVQTCAGDAIELGGSGLGLSFTKKIVEAFEEGTVSVDSEVGKGSTFRVSILLPYDRDSGASTPATAFEANPQIPSQVSSVVCILVVDDSLTNRLMLRNYLARKLGGVQQSTKIDEAADGASAVATVSAQGTLYYHAITMDFHMPGDFDGVEATRRIRELGFVGRIVGVTGEEDPIEMQRMLDAGCDAVWRKGGNLEQLVKSLHLDSRLSRERLLRHLASSSHEVS
ncbi:Ethylene receptor [Hondaea fermentalgiana]|uniref:histidine kinase n=1 Tax=Hondaea fermentalgiana TaxID=2315210 RepID=A0A2R5GIB8_9STRA|nr:Ethylene receptor [Hondaea fermentalgiana]|eukprot:GBG28031.1 Ethylene receptor [Hondaea fermentalgiana]